MGANSTISVVCYIDAALQKLTLRRTQTAPNGGDHSLSGQGPVVREVELSRIQDIHDAEACRSLGQTGKHVVPEVVHDIVGYDDFQNRLPVIVLTDGSPPACILESTE